MFKFLTPLIKRPKNENARRDHVALIESISKSLEGLDNDTALMKMELMILTSTGRWLDTWGEWFGVTRFTGEIDEIYSKRIVATTIKPKNTIPAIIDAVNEVGGYDGEGTSIFEPHKFVARHSVSKFSGKDRYQDGVYWRSGVIDLSTPFDVTEDIIETVNAVKAAGIKVFFTSKSDIWVPDGVDGFKYSDYFIPYEDYTLIVEPAIAIALKGAVFSSNTQGPRSRSGKQTLWGSYIDFGFDITLSRNYERFVGESMVLTPQDFIELIAIQPKKGIRYSHRLDGSVLSGGKIGEFEVIDTYDPTMKTDLQGNVAHQVFNLRPATRSHHGVFSGRFGFSGAPDEGWVDKPFIVISEDKAIYEYPSSRVRNEYNIFTELKLAYDNSFNKSRRSGRQILFVSDLVTIETDLTMSKQKRTLTFNDPYVWIDFLYAIRKNDEELKSQILSEEQGARSGISFEEMFSYDSTITVEQIEEWGINIQKPVERNIIHLGLPVRSRQGRRSGKYPMSGVFGDHADAIQRPLEAELVENPYHAYLESYETTRSIELETSVASSDMENNDYSIHIECGELVARRDILMSSMFKFEEIAPTNRTHTTLLGGSLYGHTEIVIETTTVESLIDFQQSIEITLLP